MIISWNISSRELNSISRSKIGQSNESGNFDVMNFSRVYQDLCDAVDLMNRAFTFQLVPVLFNELMSKTFVAYGILWELISPTQHSNFSFFRNGSWLLLMYIIDVLIALVGSSVTGAFLETKIIVTKILNNPGCDDEFTNQMLNFITRLSCRNIHLENCFFRLSWIFIIHVRTVQAKHTYK